ncbi:hypothetical protein AEAC466_07920 [Asticcacaulis sp. AC466]|nr:hypothetical protein AEAC466_07920 [Asticcacaulis sp. AC466]
MAWWPDMLQQSLLLLFMNRLPTKYMLMTTVAYPVSAQEELTS